MILTKLYLQHLLFIITIVQILTLGEKSNLQIHHQEDVVYKQLSIWNPRYETFHKTIEMLNNRTGKVIVETGTCTTCDVTSIPPVAGRGNIFHVCSMKEGCSSIIFAEWAKQARDREFFSLNNNPRDFSQVKNALVRFPNSHAILHTTPLSFLQHFNATAKSIDLLYMHSETITLNPELYYVAKPKLSRNALILLDECLHFNRTKCNSVYSILTNDGWNTILSGYQILLSRN